ncbi:hypothetical protein [Salmonella enterica]|uniref:hypothetical protein n=1 Tax=Salmonella enterica TaxID=28901 RepID=UPI00076B92F5|nr:hypothetical protein NGUA09_00013 [Salmonella enterica]
MLADGITKWDEFHHRNRVFSALLMATAAAHIVVFEPDTQPIAGVMEFFSIPDPFFYYLAVNGSPHYICFLAGNGQC